MKLIFDKSSNIEYILDADGVSIGRLCRNIVTSIKDKYNTRVNFTNPSSRVVIKNVNKVVFKGKNKMNNIKIYKHTGYPGGLSITTAKQFVEKYGIPKLVLFLSAKMLPKTLYYKKAIRENVEFK